MKIFRKLHMNFWYCLIYGSLSAIITFLLTKGGLTLSPDSINYLSIAKTINTGHLIESLVATWPPFFPLLIALINSFGFIGEESARIISIISYSVLVMVVFLLAKATTGKLVAHLASASILFFAPLLFVYSFCWSETVYITASAISVLALSMFYKTTNEMTNRYLIWGAAFVGISLLSRYIGLALFLAGLLIVLFKKEEKSTIHKIKSLILFSAIACIPLTIYLLSCWYFKGHLPGYGHHVMPSLWENTLSFFSTIYHDFLTFKLRFANINLFPYEVNWQPNIFTYLGKITGVIFLFLFITYVLLGSLKQTLRNQIVPITYIVCYILFLIFIISTHVPISLETRFCSPVYPFVIILVLSVITVGYQSFARRKTKSLFRGVSIFVVLLFWSIQLGSSANVYMRMVPDEIPKIDQNDITGDGIFDVSDLMYLVNYLYKGGPQPRPLQNANVNCDGAVNVGDIIYITNYIYRDGPPPCNLEDH